MRKKGIALAELPESSAASFDRLRESATALGTHGQQSHVGRSGKCANGYSMPQNGPQKLRAEKPIENGATLINQARVLKVLVENDRAIGVE